MVEGGRVLILDGWRGLAVLLVLAGHFTGYYWLSGFGVELFFVLSGRLMANVLVEQRQNLRTFVGRRVMRILPALSVFIAITVLVGAAADVPARELRQSATAAALFFSNYLVGSDILTVFQHTWSLAVEEHSYIALAAIVLLARGDPRKCGSLALGVALLMMIIAGARAILGDEGWQLYLRSETRGASILVSFALATYARQVANRIPPFILQWASPTAFGAALVLACLNLPATIFCTIGTLCLAVSVNLVDHSHEWVGRVLRDSVLRWFGLVSFSLYLWQQPFYAAHVTGLSATTAAPLALLFGVASFYLVEKPARRMFRRPDAANPSRIRTAS
ncbi:MAG TPA: acyltransferase [Sphingomicrobium sp.]|nr:acyltransferase [Sphingomicrobium sp.]